MRVAFISFATATALQICVSMMHMKYEKLYTVTIMTNEPHNRLVCAFTLTA
jgi:hypothetical protein